MRHTILNLAALLPLAVGVLGHGLGFLSDANAFFLAFFGMALYTGSQFAVREGMTLGAAVVSLVRDPATYPTRRVGQVTYLGSTLLGSIALAQIALHSL